jgi:hypothetical protein
VQVFLFKAIHKAVQIAGLTHTNRIPVQSLLNIGPFCNQKVLRSVLRPAVEDHLMNAELIAIGIVIACFSFVFGVYVGLAAKEATEEGRGL